ncbi:peptidyl-prolyl cis-trans isomerase [Neiella marina]|uniref:Peptidyl-prolyl cis-trans isomerase n=1 Tax=Neiella marina TaxID=508461 RepID=A0A8J2U3R4_9GAMM|nr:peptidylprolyl isomerase [Neiella marina]GGA71350.1 peptidyl-prolyl cis-trans isomerase [Neiella marina]
MISLATKYFRLAAVCCLFLLSTTAQAKDADVDAKLLQPDNLFPVVKMETNMGVIMVELDRPKAPVTVDNFLKYVVTGAYDNTAFHRIIEGFVVQGGGMDEKYNSLDDTFGSITNEAGNGLLNDQYSIAMARQSHPHSAGRQFYFNVDDNKSLDPGPRSWGYTVFGRIVEGEDVIDKMSEVPTEFNADLSLQDVPVNTVILRKATLLPPDA